MLISSRGRLSYDLFVRDLVCFAIDVDPNRRVRNVEEGARTKLLQKIVFGWFFNFLEGKSIEGVELRMQVKCAFARKIVAHTDGFEGRIDCLVVDTEGQMNLEGLSFVPAAVEYFQVYQVSRSVVGDNAILV